MLMRSQPHGHHIGLEEPGQISPGNQSPVGQVTGRLGALVLQEKFADATPQTISANQAVSLGQAAPFTYQADPLSRLFKCEDLTAQLQLHPFQLLQAFEQQPMQISSVQRGIRSAITLHRLRT